MCNFFRSPLIWYNPNISHCTNVHHMQFGIGTVSRKGIRNFEGFFSYFSSFLPCRLLPLCTALLSDASWYDQKSVKDKTKAISRLVFWTFLFQCGRRYEAAAPTREDVTGNGKVECEKNENIHVALVLALGQTEYHYYCKRRCWVQGGHFFRIRLYDMHQIIFWQYLFLYALIF